MLIRNLLTPLAESPAAEVFEELLRGREFRVERIVSTGQSTPEGEWYDQDWDEWVVLLTGQARLRLADGTEHALHPGDALHLPAHHRHRVEWTDPTQQTVWLAVHFRS